MNETFEVAERRHGLITRAQLANLGLSDAQIQRRVSAGILARALPNVFRVVGSVPTTAQRQLGACLWVGRSAVLSHTSAGMLMRLEGITTNEVHVTVPAQERRRGHGIVVARRPGAAALRRVLAAAEHRAVESRLEVKLARLLRSSRLPVSVPQHRIGPYRVDRAWPDRRVAVEADGFQHHGRRLAWKRDRTRVAAIEAMGWRLVHVTWADVVERPVETLDRIGHALGTIAA